MASVAREAKQDPKAALAEGLGLESRQYEALESDFQEVLNELAGDKSLERFRIEYEKLYRTLKKSHDNEKRLIKKCRELNSEIVATALKLSEEDQATINALKREIEKSWRLEAKAKETIAALKEEVAQLQIDQILAMRGELVETTEKVRRLEADKAALEADVAGLRQQIADKKSEAEREARKRERLEKEARDLKASVEARMTEVRSKQAEVQAAEEQVERLEASVKEARAATDRVTKLHHDLEEAVHANSQLLADNGARQVEIKAREEELAAVRAEVARVSKVRDAALKKAKAADDARDAVETERDALRGQIASLERDVAAAKQARLGSGDCGLSGGEAEVERRRLEDLGRERDVLIKLRSTAENATSRQADLVRVAENTRKNLENEIQGYRAEAARASKSIWSMEREREKYSTEAAETAAKYQQARMGAGALEEVRVREVAIVELQKRIAEGEGRLKQQQALYEAVRADRNLYSKTLIEAQDEINELKRKSKITSHQVEQLKEEIGVKDLALVEKEKDALRLELTKAKLKAVVVEADAERLRQRKEFELVMGERDVLGSQLIRRNDELALLYEKVKLQGAALARGAVQVSEIRVLKVRLADLRRQLHVLRSGAANVEALKREVASLGRALLGERTKVRALSEELETPLNVHRWRKLEGSDPTAYEMIQKIQALQRRLISKTEEAVEKDMLIREKEKLYVELKNILARQPGPEAAEQIALYQGALRDKTKQLRAMAGELNMAQAQARGPTPQPAPQPLPGRFVAGYKYEIERLTHELADLKRRWFDAKRREQQQGQRAGGGSGGGGGTVGRLGAGAGGEEQQGQQQQATGGAGDSMAVTASKAPSPPPAVKGGGFAMA
ncbi:flagellar associated protein [Raphidocelis subcapitata]|uniref:Flagellar associated protein n=1 Tax=Raphidocelis subcapitata TaxID=307507 RepID=A0A2V0PFX9_9CHLO|nr:flagellar associated protein [Raphidocelis subcapitata]|eukprot:GBF96803.1 flagellar associated protein [Raphidocelis subcapitata]